MKSLEDRKRKILNKFYVAKRKEVTALNVKIQAETQALILLNALYLKEIEGKLPKVIALLGRDGKKYYSQKDLPTVRVLKILREILK